MINRTWFAALLMAALVTGLIAPMAYAQDGEWTVVAEGFNGPMGVLVDPDGNVWVIDSGLGGDEEVQGVDPESGQEITATYGDTAQVVRVEPDGTQTVVADLPSIFLGTDTTGGARLALLDGDLYATVGIWQGVTEEALPNTGGIVRIDEDGTLTEVAQLWRTEQEMNPDETILDSHPYGLAAGPDGMLWATDAGGNTLLRVDPEDGTVEVVAVFQPLPGVFPSPTRGGEMLADPVPTGIAFDDDGNALVTLLSGAPFVPGSAKVVQVTPDGEQSDYATNLTMLTDLQRGPDGEFYAVQFALFTDQGPTPNSGALVRVQEGDASEVVVQGLPFPTSVDFNADGDAYVTINGVGAPGSGQVILVEGVTEMMGQMEEMEPAEEEAAAEESEASEEAEEADEAEEAEAAEETAPTSDDEPTVAVEDQESGGSQVVVPSSYSVGPGWMVIHADADGRPGPVLGQTAVAPGQNENIIVMLAEPISGETTLWAMLHVDEGEVGTYEFPGADVPARVGDDIVMLPFTVTAPEAVAEEAEAEEAEAEEAEEEEAEETPAPEPTEAAAEEAPAPEPTEAAGEEMPAPEPTEAVSGSAMSGSGAPSSLPNTGSPMPVGNIIAIVGAVLAVLGAAVACRRS